MSLLTVAELKALVTSPLADEQLQAVIDRVEAEATVLIGSAYDGTAIDEVVAGGGCNLFLKRPVESISSVTEFSSLGDVTGSTLTDSSDFFIWASQGRLERLGGNWGARAAVSYVPRDDRAQRKQAIIDLVRIVLTTTPLQRESLTGVGSYEKPDNWEAEKQRILGRLIFQGV